MYIFLNSYVNFFTLLETKRKKIHRGSLLEAAVKSSSIKISQMVKRMNISRGTYYNHINDPQLSYEQMAAYGKELKYDFTQDIPEMKKFLFEEPEAMYQAPKNLKEAIEQRDYWREKYYQLMEKYHKDIIEKR